MNRANNFDLLRLIAAISVIFSHAFLLSEGHQNNEPLVWLTGQAVLGLMGVFVFFVISGFLVTQSYERTQSLPRFTLKRFLRIYPGLTICMLFCAGVLGSLVTSLPLRDYLTHSDTYRFIAMNLLMQTHTNTLPGVKFTAYDIGGIVNGPLWSLPFELFMYGMVAVLGVLRLLRTPVLVFLWVLGVFCAYIDTSTRQDFMGGVFWLLGFFSAGMLIYKLQGPWLYDRRLALFAVVGLVFSASIHHLIALFPIFGAFLTMHLALDPRIPSIKAAKFGDLSYGLYIYGWPVEQTILWATGGKLNWWELFAIALPVTAALAFISWHVIEKPAMALRQKRKSAAVPIASN